MTEACFMLCIDTQINGNRTKDVIFEEISSILTQLQNEKVKAATRGDNLIKFKC